MQKHIFPDQHQQFIIQVFVLPSAPSNFEKATYKNFKILTVA